MLLEVKKLFENIKHFRHLITESVGEGDMKKYIQDHEYIYMYYTGDGNNKAGYRTIRPYVLGTSTAGNLVVRAYQDNKNNSHDYVNRPTRPKNNPNMDDSKYHDYWVDEHGEVPGWRMFRLDKISNMYPTGKKFNDSNGDVMIPAGYHEGGDDNMSSIIAYVSTKNEPDFDYKYDVRFTGEELPAKEQRTAKWDSIRNGDKNRRKIDATEVSKLRDIASRVYKKKIGSFVVVIDDKNNFQIILATDKEKQNIPDTAVVGSLANLYDTLVRKTPPEDFFRKSKNKLDSELKENKLPSIPFEKKTFFKQ